MLPYFRRHIDRPNRIGASTALDHESPADSGSNNVYDVTVQVTDGKDAGGNADTSIDDTIGVTITVTERQRAARIRRLLPFR